MDIARFEPRWIDLFVEIIALAGPRAGETAAVLSERGSRPELVALAEFALHRYGVASFRVTVPTSLPPAGVPLRSTGTSRAIAGSPALIDALAGADLIVDVTIEGLLHARERPALLARGARIFMIGNETVEIFERLPPMSGLHGLCLKGAEMISAATRMRVTSAAGSDLVVDLNGAIGRGSAGTATEAGGFGYWPAGLCLTHPLPGAVNGRLVFKPGDANLTFKRYFSSSVTLCLEQDFVTAIEGDSLDAELMRSYFTAFDSDSYAVSHVGWGMNPAARWDALVMYDKADVNGIELRAFAGNFLFSTGANETANRFTDGHFDLPMRDCTVQLDDDEPVVTAGVLRADLRITA